MAAHRDLASTYDLAEVGLDDFETGLLKVLRHFCVSFAEPQSQGWIAGYGTATDLWGISAGPKAAQAVFLVLDAMQRRRVSVFQYNNPACVVCSKRMTGNERHMMQMLHNMRVGKIAKARIDAMLLVEGGDTNTVLVAAYNLANLFPVEACARALAEPAGAAHMGRES